LVDKKPAAQQEVPVTPKNIGEEIDLFVNQIDALADTLPLATAAIQGARITSSQQLGKFLKEECTVTAGEGSKVSYTFQGNQYLKFQRFQRRVQRAELAQILVPRGLLVALVSQFDAYVGGVVRQLFRAKPEILDSSGKQLTFAQLSEFTSIEEARAYVIEKEIESVLRESHADQFAWLESKFNIPLRKDLPAWPVFIELTERRNLFVHTNGIVSRQYLEVCRKQSCELPADVSVGSSLPLSREYFNGAYECLFEIGFKLGQVLWRKIQPADLTEADRNLTTVTYNLLTEGRYQLARVLLDFATETLKKHFSEQARLRLVVNRAQVYKWTGDEQKCRAVLDAEDWSATDDTLKLACAVLKDDFKKADRLVVEIGNQDSELDKHAYREWPLFKEYRKSAEFIALFENIFGEPLNKFVVKTADGGVSGPMRPN
jgi:hypothetical protein